MANKDNGSHFSIGDYHIDLRRSVVTRNEQETALEPKVLKVLSLLAHRHNDVVTHQEIMDTVWHGSEVVPNALQRCIAILRKVLGDDAKSPHIIATHPRIGYRLIAEVTWAKSAAHTPTCNPQIDKATTTKTFYTRLVTITLILLVIIIGSIGAWRKSLHGEGQHNYSQVRPITQTDAHETHAIYNPEGSYIIFNRYAGGCKSHVWAKHVISGQESQLTLHPGDFGAPAFTPDGREIVFAARGKCNDESAEALTAEPAQCWSIASLDFSSGLDTPQVPKLRHQCQAENLQSPKALANHQYVFLQSEGGWNQLMHYDDLSKVLTPFFTAQGKYIYHFDYDSKNQRFAVMSRNKHIQNVLEILNEKGEVISSKTIQIAPEMSRHLEFPANFEPTGKYLLAVSNKKLYKLSFDGKLELIKTPTTNLLSVVQHPKNTSLLATQGNKDIDIAEVVLSKDKTTQYTTDKANRDLNDVTLPYPSMARTTAQERLARYQPGGTHIAFISDRTGSDQIWIWRDGKVSQLSFESSGNPIHSYSWSPDGTELSWISENQLLISDLKGKARKVNLKKPAQAVISWSRENQILLLLSAPQPNSLHILKLSNNELTPLGVSHVNNAWVVDEILFYSNSVGHTYSVSLARFEQNTHRKINLRGHLLHVNKEALFSVNKKDLKLRKYQLIDNFEHEIMLTKPNAWKLTDAKADTFFFSQFVAINNEIVIIE